MVKGVRMHNVYPKSVAESCDNQYQAFGSLENLWLRKRT